MRKILFALLLSGCSSSTPYTWGTASEQLAEAYCTRLTDTECGFDLNPTVCAEHTRFHLCEVPETCDRELPDAAELAVLDCADAMLDYGCAALWYGFLPPECGEVLDYGRPE